ncbi:uncharacterized protein LOC121876175 [Homarus americanus]|uniref:Putative Myb/SANT-like DNA-binding domain-containing protein 24 n=1 Tax=Homarus americanus TaxID=6706 RepID=A0A8J5JQ90_HOMAM|nr:uncharacterized protein LOC121876175 [Homarus americanus]KAG7160331.1 putative Myb/SANT-like DNA-binding domain-containing protein 24 [Homarus americanus]
MADSPVVVDPEGYEELPEEEVETSYMCGACFQLFPTTEDFHAHQCQITGVDNVENVVDRDGEEEEPHTSSLDVSQHGTHLQKGVWEARESEAAMEEAVASILGERMKRTAPQKSTCSDIQFDQTLIVPAEHSIEHTSIIDHMEPVVEHTVENIDQSDGSGLAEGIEIPSANVYMYDNPVYLNRLMKDNTFGRRVRHDAPYSHRLGPWDNKSSRLLIHLLKEYPKAYFILDKECKRTEAWEIIRVKLAEAGYQFTVLQIRMRWRELCKKYRNTANHNDLYNTRKTCQYLDDLNSLFGVWDRHATLLLIKQLEVNGSKRLGQNGGTRMRHKVWDQIRQVLLTHGYQYTADQVQGRWSTLVTLYQRMVEHNSKPHNEKITIAYKDYIERVFKYVPERNSKWLKIMEKRGKKPKTLKKNWTVPIERHLLAYYHERVYRFNNEHVNNTELWQEIVQKLEDIAGYSTTVDKVRTRFYELTKQFSIMEQHNAQPGTIRRECRHHETLAEIYSIYNYWPHDRSTIKLEKSNAIRMRQVNSQLAWSEDESRTLLQLYPQVLVAHLSSGEHQPIEELWLQLAKAYLNTQNDRKQCYEIEDHIALLRRGYHSQNPFPFVSEMQLLEETELTLSFTPEPLPIDDDQLVPFWSHTAAHLLLDFVMHHRQEGVKNSGLFELVSRDLASCGYRYTGEECRLYYSLLRQLYTNRMRTIKRKRELLKPFPYMEKMAEVDNVVSQPSFVETEENRKIILSAALSRLEIIEGENEDGQRDYLVNWLTTLKLYLKRTALFNPPPAIKYLARTLAETIEDSSIEGEYKRFDDILGPHLDLLNSIAERGGSSIVYQPSVFKNRGKKMTMSKTVQTRYGSVQWSEANLRTMLNTVKEWRLLCHDGAELEHVLNSSEALWKEVASRLSGPSKVDPSKCQERFIQMCREYKSVVSFNARLSPTETIKTIMCQEILEQILTPLICHDAEIDVRDEWWASEEGGNWNRTETLELLFTVRELWPGWPKMDWEMVSLMMNASGYKHDDVGCKKRFQQLYSGYQAAFEHNKTCGIRARRRPPFYFKLNTLFGNNEFDEPVTPDLPGMQEVEVDEAEALHVLVMGLKEVKGHYCHSVPRRPLLMTLSLYLNEHFHCTSSSIPPYEVWHFLLQLHHIHREAALQKTEVAEHMNLGELWQNHPIPLIAFGLHALPLLGWNSVCDWSVDEVYLLVETVFNWELQPRNLQSAGKTMAKVASELLKTRGFEKTPQQCQDQWEYLVAAYRQGGYKQLSGQMNLIHLLAPSILHPQPTCFYPSVRVSKNLNQQRNCRTNICKQPHKATQTQKLQTTAIQPPSAHKDSTLRPLKKMKVESHDMTVLSVSEENLQKIKRKKSAPGNVVSYVQINVLQQSTPQKRHVQVSTDEMKDWEEGLGTTSFSVKKETGDMESISTSSTTLSVPIVSDSIKSVRIQEHKSDKKQGIFKPSGSFAITMKTASGAPSRKVTYFLQSDGNSEDDRVQVEVLNVMESENGKLVECCTGKGITPARTIKLHYPPTHPIPSGLTHMYLPRMLVHPDVMTAAKKIQLPDTSNKFSSSISERDSSSSSFSIPCQLNLKTESEEIECEESGLHLSGDESFTSFGSDGKDDEPGRWRVMKLLEQYRQHCRQEKTRLLQTLQESHQQQTSILKQILTVFQQLQNSF